MGEPLRRYDGTRGPNTGSVKITVLILAQDESLNIGRCIESAGWARQVVIIDSGSSDNTIELAKRSGAEAVNTYWRGFGPQRDFALSLEQVRHEWVFFLDADEWVSVELAEEIAEAVTSRNYAAYWQYKRLIFQGRWIRHCGWYPSARTVTLMRRGTASFGDQSFSEHAEVSGTVGRLRNDIVDEDLKGLASWLAKHVRYAELEARRRETHEQSRIIEANQSVARSFMKNWLAPRMPARPAAQFFYMYILKQGFRDGYQGLLFCFYHAWFQTTVSALQREASRRAAQRTGGIS